MPFNSNNAADHDADEGWNGPAARAAGAKLVADALQATADIVIARVIVANFEDRRADRETAYCVALGRALQTKRPDRVWGSTTRY